MKRIGTGPNGEVLLEMSRDEASVVDNLRAAAIGFGWIPGNSHGCYEAEPVEKAMGAAFSWVALKFNLWAEDDWRDLYKTIEAFKARLAKRHQGKDSESDGEPQ